MQMRLDMPYLDRTASSGRIRVWFKESGDPIAPGDPICEILAETQTVLEVTRNAKLLTRLSKNKVSTSARQVRRPVAWRVIAREAGTLHSVVTGIDGVEVGDAMAVITIPGGDDSVPTDISDLSEFRAYCERAPEEGDEA